MIGLYATVRSLALGQDIWGGMKFAGAPFLGERAMQSGFDFGAVIVGVIVHFAVSLGWGLVFGLIAYGLSRPATVAWSLPFGVVVWLAMFYLILPLCGLGQVAREQPIANALVEHLIFGGAVGFAFLPFQREERIKRAMPEPS